MKPDKDILIGKFLSGNISPREQEELNKWLDESEKNRRQLEEAQKMWQLSAGLKKQGTGYVEQAWEEFKELAAAEPKVRKLDLRVLKAAAVIALFVSTAFLVKFFLLAPEPVPVVAQVPVVVQPAVIDDSVDVSDTTSVIATPIHKQPRKKRVAKIAAITVSTGDSAAIYLLPDGSKAYLNKHSSLTYSGPGRNLTLRGEAYFEVKPDTLPFFVSCGNTLTRALGTSFNIKGYDPAKVEVMVITGQVEVADQTIQSNKMALKAGETAAYGKNKESAFVKSKNHKKDKWWKRKSLKNRIKQFFSKLKNKIN